MASIEKRVWRKPDGESVTRYDATITRKGSRRRTKTFKLRTAAERWVRLVEAEIERGVFKSTDIAERTLLRDIMRRYLKEVAPLKKTSSQKSGSRP